MSDKADKMQVPISYWNDLINDRKADKDRIEELEADNKLIKEDNAMLISENEAQGMTITNLTKENKALREYATHKKGCGKTSIYCTCGFIELSKDRTK